MSKSNIRNTNSKKRRIFLLEDHLIFRDGFSKLLNAEEDLAVCGEAGDARQALKLVPRLKPDLVVVDIGLPGKSGLEFIKEIRALKIPSKLLAVSMFDEAIYAQRVLRAGGDGYIMKQEDPEEIVHAIRDVLAGHIYVSENVFSRDSSTRGSPIKNGVLDLLTDAELEVLESLGKGKSKAIICVQLRSSKAEIQAHIESIRRKLKFNSEKLLINYATSWVRSSQEMSGNS
jgi:DNA-binding NarL/FixJ family response regulator